MLQNRKMITKSSKLLGQFIIAIVLCSASFSVLASSYTKRNFAINAETEVILDIEGDLDTFYNGSITVTVTDGIGVNVTVNSVTSEVTNGESNIFAIDNTSTLYFEISSDGFSSGYYELELNLNPNAGDRNPVTITVGILAALLIGVSVVSYYIRAKKLEPKEDEEDEEMTDPEVARKRKEAAGAEKRYLGLDDNL